MATPARAWRSSPATGGGKSPRLRVVRPPHKKRARVPFVVVCLVVLVGSMLGALILNTLMAQAAYEMHSTQVELARTLQTNQELSTKVDQLSAPERLARKAESLGMVPGESVTYIDLDSATLIGSPNTSDEESQNATND